MTEIKANIDGESIQQAIASAVLESSIGEHVKAAIEKHLKETYTSRSVVETAVNAAVNEMVRDYAIELVRERRDAWKEQIEAKLTDQILDAALDGFIAKCLDSGRW